MDHPSYRAIAHAIRRRSTRIGSDPMSFPELGAEVHFLPAHSRHGHHLLGRDGYRCEEHGVDFPAEPTADGLRDCDIAENQEFRYPLLRGRATGGTQGRARHLIVVICRTLTTSFCHLHLH